MRRQACCLLLLVAGCVLTFQPSLHKAQARIPQAAPTPLPTAYVESINPRLQPPRLPDQPTQAEQGQVVYYYHCMPCHGDQGQGLTDEFRSLWVPDHQDCWSRGCHTGRSGDDGFSLPRFIPPVVREDRLAAFPSAQDLFTFLKEQHPPQRPGALSKDEAQQVTAYLLEQNSRELPASATTGKVAGLGMFLLASLVLALSLATQARHTGQGTLPVH